MLFWRQQMQTNQKFAMSAAIWTDWNGVVDRISFGCSRVHATFWVKVLFDCCSYAACWLWENVADARTYIISLPMQKHGCMLWHSKHHFLQQNWIVCCKIRVDCLNEATLILQGILQGWSDHCTKGRAPLQHLQTVAYCRRPTIHKKVYAAKHGFSESF